MAGNVIFRIQTVKKIVLIICVCLHSVMLNAQVITLDDFESIQRWSINKSDGVNVNLSADDGLTGKAIRLDYDFTKGTGYGGIQKLLHLDIPDNYEFTFYIKADSPPNNLEIKFIDSTGNNVWWVNNRNYTFPQEWTKITIKKRHITFAWGPTADHDLRSVDRIEFTIASFVGGKGTIWIDDLRFEPLPPETDIYPEPAVSASSSMRKHFPGLMSDGSEQSFWLSRKHEDQNVIFDFMTRREYGGLRISWLSDHYASVFDVLISDDGIGWHKVYSVTSNQSDLSFIRLPEEESRYLKLDLIECNSEEGFGISEVEFINVHNSLTINDFIIYAAGHSAEGDYPRYFLRQASYWTISGVNHDVREALINEDAMVEVDKGLFSIEPLIKTGGILYNWSNVVSAQSLGSVREGAGPGFIPSVTWQCGDLKFITGVASSGEANRNSVLNIRYEFENISVNAIDFEFYLLLRPYQVNPYYQALNLTGGAGKIYSIGEKEHRYIIADNKVVIPQEEYAAFGAFRFDDGNIVDLIRKGRFPSAVFVNDSFGQAGGVIKYVLKLEPGMKTSLYVVVPFYGGNSSEYPVNINNVADEFESVADYWHRKVSHIKFNLPESADRIINTYRAMLYYILVNKDMAGIQPGSRSYERSWIRDGSLTSSALLKSGIVTDVRDFIEWYAAHQYENGKVPCVVDFRGPDPVPENDSHGELIYLIREYFNFTNDTVFLRSKNKNVLKAVDYMEYLMAQRSTDHFRTGNDSIRAYYGLVPESISHEGYSAKPMHSYWDDFFTMKGLKDAAEIQRILGEKENFDRIAGVRDRFRENLYNSLDLAMKVRKIDYIPGCVELGDFDATSTTISLTPCNEINNLPKPQIYNTFDMYYEFFMKRRDGRAEWINYTPYENRVIGSFIMLDQPDRAHELIDYFLSDQRPRGWYQWAEVVWNDYRYPGFIGDMPHTWCGSDFINAIRSMFVYENEYDRSLVLASALYQDWIDTPGGMSVMNLPTYYGEISYSIKKEGFNYHFSISGDLNLPVNGLMIRNFNGCRLPLRVVINGMESTDFNEKQINVKALPADIMIYY